MEYGITLKMILQQQQTWAINNSIDIDKTGERSAYTHYLAENLFYDTLSVQTVDEYSAGQGRELQTHMRALHSSSALLVNVFEYWRQTHRVSEIADIFGASEGITTMEFEKKHKISNLGTPHLDIELSGEYVKPFAVEAKYTEPYGTKTQRNGTNLDKYLKQNALWEGLPNFKELAQEILGQESKKTSWRHLDVPQLIKHVLGLSYCYKPDGFTLLYLWFNTETDEAQEHLKEIQLFNERIKADVTFKNMTYQELFTKIKHLANVNPNYLEYLKKRYFDFIFNVVA